jgi:hypothetical protein
MKAACSRRHEAWRKCFASRTLTTCTFRQQGHGMEIFVPSAGTATNSDTATMMAISVAGHMATNRFMKHERFAETLGSGRSRAALQRLKAAPPA